MKVFMTPRLLNVTTKKFSLIRSCQNRLYLPFAARPTLSTKSTSPIAHDHESYHKTTVDPWPFSRHSLLTQKHPMLSNNVLLRPFSSTTPLSESAKEDIRQSQDAAGATAEQNQISSKPLTQRQKLTKLFAEYGTTAFVVHTSLSLTSLGIFYTLVTSGIDMVALLQKVGLAGEGLAGKMTSGASTFVVAYACHKVFMPVRVFLTISCTPVIVKKLRAIGFLRAPLKKPQT